MVYADFEILKQKYRDLQLVLDENIRFENKRIDIQNRATRLLDMLQKTGTHNDEAETALRIRAQTHAQAMTVGSLNMAEETLHQLEEKYHDVLYRVCVNNGSVVLQSNRK